MTDGPELFRIGLAGVVPVQWSMEKADDGPGTLTGWASVYNVVDQQDDVVAPGAFRKWLSEWRASKRVIPLTLDHQNTAEGVIGSLAKAEDSPYGLKATFQFSSTTAAQDARTKAREGHLNGLSIWGPIIAKSFTTVDGKAIRILKEVGLASVGLTPIPANTDSVVLKAATAEPDPKPDLVLDFDEFTDAMRKALDITHPAAMKAAVHVLLGSYRAEPAGNPDGEPAEAAVVQKDAADEEAAAYALSIAKIGESGPDQDPPGGEPIESLADELLASVDAEQSRKDMQVLAAELKSAQEAL